MSKFNELAWIAEAKRHVGLTENVNGKPNPILQKWLKDLKAWWSDSSTAWCGVFIAHCLQSVGLPYPKEYYRALSWQNFGRKLLKPCYGCVAVKSRKGGGHVTFVVGQTPQGLLVCLGGNQSDMVKYSLYKKEDFIAFVWTGKSFPLDVRYELPVITDVKTGSIKES